MPNQRGADPAGGPLPATDLFPREVGARLRLVRLAIGLPAHRLAAEFNVLPPRWSQWEHGRHLADLRTMGRLCRRYRVTLDYLYLGDDSGLPRRLLDAIRDAARS